MADADTDMANMALSFFSGGTISSINGADKISKLCKLFISKAINQAIIDGEYYSTVKRQALVINNSATEIPEFQYAYSIPNVLGNICVKPIRLESGATFQMEGTVLYTDDPEPVLVYIVQTTSVSNMSPHVQKVVALYLADFIVMEATNGDISKKRLIQSELLKAKSEAKYNDNMSKFGKNKGSKRWTDI